MASDLTSVGFWQRKHDMAARPTQSWLRRRVRRRTDAMLRQFAGLAREPKARLLEIGCSPGRMLERLHAVRADLRLHGIDYSEDGVATSRRWLRQAGIKATIHHGDARAIDLRTQFDVVCSFGLIEHFDDPVPMLHDHARFCRPGGYVAVAVPNYASSVVRSLIQMFDPGALETHSLKIMHPLAIERAMQQAGLECVKVGACGAPRVRAEYEPRRWFGGAFRACALSWNVAVSLIPFDMLWHSTIWATGRVAEPCSRQYDKAPAREQHE